MNVKFHINTFEKNLMFPPDSPSSKEDEGESPCQSPSYVHAGFVTFDERHG
jgi:hypothetical protein